MHILFTRFPLESILGGAEIQTLSLMDGLIARGHAVSFAGSCPILLRECAARGIPVHSCDIGEPPVTKMGAISFLWRKKKMQATLLELMNHISPPDAICMLSLSEKLLLTNESLRDLQPNTLNLTPIFWIEHDPMGRWLTWNPWLKLLRRNSRTATTITVSNLSRDLYLHLGWNHDRTIAIPNGINLDRIGPPLQRTRTSAQEPLRLGCIARLSKEKGIDVLLRAMQNVPTHVTLAIAGTGKEEHALRHMAENLNITDRVTFLLPETNIRTLYEQFDAFILPSRSHDPFGLTVAEAMALGLPAILTDACGIAESFDGTEAIVVPANSAEALMEGIQHILDPDAYNRIAENAAHIAREKFSIEKMVQSYENLFTTTTSASTLL